jgi:uncharacterized membrane protein YjjB (DUF3815 family)
MNILGVTAIPRDKSPLWVQITALPVGGVIAAFFGWCLYYEMRSPPTHTSHIVIFSGGVLLGLLVAFGRWFLFPVLVQTVYIIGPLIPGGRRKYDPPAGTTIYTDEHTGERTRVKP